jgi:hypothetical protein
MSLLKLNTAGHPSPIFSVGPVGPVERRIPFAIGLPQCVRPSRPSLNDKKPQIVEEFRSVLDDWLYNDDALQQDRLKANAIGAYCSQTIQYAHAAGVTRAFDYHLEAGKAATRHPYSLWDPVKGGPTYFPAFQQYIYPFISAGKPDN